MAPMMLGVVHAPPFSLFRVCSGTYTTFFFEIMTQKSIRSHPTFFLHIGSKFMSFKNWISECIPLWVLMHGTLEMKFFKILIFVSIF